MISPWRRLVTFTRPACQTTKKQRYGGAVIPKMAGRGSRLEDAGRSAAYRLTSAVVDTSDSTMLSSCLPVVATRGYFVIGFYDRPIMQGIIYFAAVFSISFFLSFFPCLFSAVGDWNLYRTSTHDVALMRTANLERRSKMCCMRLAGNTRRKNDFKNSASTHHGTTLSSYIFARKACIDNRKKTC